MTAREPLDYQPKSQSKGIPDDIAYMLPMGVFLALVWVGGQWTAMYPLAYVARTIIVAILLVVLWKHYTKISWRFWWLGAIVGVIGIFQWIGMQLWLQKHFEFFAPSKDVFDPTKVFDSPALMWSFIAVRIIGAVLVVPVMEELFWRDFAWRTILAPANFKLASIGEWNWKPLIIVSLIFGTVHGNWWLTAIVWGLMIGLLLVYTKSIGACIIAHAVTNALLAGYVLWKDAWAFW